MYLFYLRKRHTAESCIKEGKKDPSKEDLQCGDSW
jgi:hypothetical protein